MSVGPKRGRSVADIVDDMLSKENYPDIARVIHAANDKFVATKGSERAAVREFLTTLVQDGFFVSYKPERLLLGSGVVALEGWC